MSPDRPPKDDLVRAMFPAVELRAAAEPDGMPTLAGHFAVFDRWTEIDSVWEGRFLESIAPGSFRKTFAENRNAMRVLFQHGRDPQVGDKPLGPIEVLEEDETGARYEVPLLDTGYVRELVPGLEAGLYGASFRFTVMKEEYEQRPKPSAHNPEALPERTIKEARVAEFGPVTFPAYPDATAGVRSLTDAYVFDRFVREPERLAEVLTALRAERAALPSDGADPGHSVEGSRGAPLGAPPPIAADKPPLDTEKESSAVEYQTREDKASRVAELEAALSRMAVEYPGVMPSDAQERWDADNKERDTLTADIEAWDARVARVESFAGKATHADVPRGADGRAIPNQINRKSETDIFDFYRPDQERTPEARVQMWRDNAMRAIEGARYPTNDDKRTRDRVADLLDHHDSPDQDLARRIIATGSPLYRRAFEKIIKGRGTVSLTPEEQRGTALAVGVDATGGFTVPFAFDPTVIAIGSWSGAVNPYRRVCRIVSIVGTDTWNAITSTAVVATRTTEAAVTIEQGPTFAQPQYIVKRVQGQITASIEMFQDRADLASEMATLIQEAKDNEEETSWATGAGAASASIGVGPVNGTTGAYTSITTAASVTLAAADADAVEAALPPRHRFGAQWFLNRLSIRRFQTLETTGGKLFSGNQYQAVGVPELDRAGNTGLRLLGYPVNESPSLPTAQTANIVIGTLLAPSSYVIVERVGMSVNFIPFIFGASQGNLVTGQQAIYFLWRNHAAPINVDAGRTLRYLT